MIYLWHKPAMQALIQAVRADTRVKKKFGEYNQTMTEYETKSSSAAYDMMLRYARRFTPTEKDAKLMLSVCTSHVLDEVKDHTTLRMLMIMILVFSPLVAGYLYILMPFALLIDIYILYAVTYKKRYLRRMWNAAKSDCQAELMYNELISMEAFAQKPLILCIPLETVAAGLLIVQYAVWIYPNLV